MSAAGAPLTIRAPEPDTALVSEIKEFIREFNEYNKPKESNSNANVNAEDLLEQYEHLEAQINQFDEQQKLKYKDLIDRFTECGKKFTKQGGGRRTKKVNSKKSRKSKKSRNSKKSRKSKKSKKSKKSRKSRK